jgi:hypothetical protein
MKRFGGLYWVDRYVTEGERMVVIKPTVCKVGVWEVVGSTILIGL